MTMQTNSSLIVFDNIETALFDLGRYSEVEKFYRKVLENNPKDLNAGLRLTNVLNEWLNPSEDSTEEEEVKQESVSTSDLGTSKVKDTSEAFDELFNS